MTATIKYTVDYPEQIRSMVHLSLHDAQMIVQVGIPCSRKKVFVTADWLQWKEAQKRGKTMYVPEGPCLLLLGFLRSSSMNVFILLLQFVFPLQKERISR